MHECMYMFSHILSYILYYLQKSIPSFKKIWPFTSRSVITHGWLPTEERQRPPTPNFRYTLTTRCPRLKTWLNGLQKPRISTFYTIIKQWEFDHFGLLGCCVASSSSSSDNYSNSNTSYGSG